LHQGERRLLQQASERCFLHQPPSAYPLGSRPSSNVIVFLCDTQFECDRKTKDIASRSAAWRHCNKVSCHSSVMNLAICRLSYHAHAGFFITFLMRSFTIACTTIACTTIPCTRAFAYIATHAAFPPDLKVILYSVHVGEHSMQRYSNVRALRAQGTGTKCGECRQ